MGHPGRKAPLLPPLLFLVLGLAALWHARKAPVGDYGNYYYASRLWLEGQFDARAYDPFAFNEAVAGRTDEPLFLNYTPVPPLSVIAYLPFAFWEEVKTSKRWFNLGGLLVFCLAFFRFLRSCSGGNARLWQGLLPLVFAIPLLNTLLQGQSYLWLLAAILEGFLQWEQKRRWAAGLLWGLPIALKVFPVVLLVLPLLDKDWRTFLYTAGPAGALSLLPGAFLPESIVGEYFFHILPRLFSGQINDPFALLYQSGDVMIRRLLVYDQHLNPFPIWDRPGMAHTLEFVYKGIILLILILLLPAKRADAQVRLGLVFLGAVLLSGYGSSYGLMLLLPLGVAIPRISRRPLWVGLALLLLTVASWAPVYLLHDRPWWQQYPRLYVFWGILAWLLVNSGIGIRDLGRALLVCFAVLSVKYFLARPSMASDGEYYLPDGRYGIIADYRADGQVLELRFLPSSAKAQRARLPLTDRIWEDKRLHLQEGQIYWGEQAVTHSPGNKRLPRRLNEQDIIYLSDEGRGPGFYTLRKIQMK